MRACLVVGVLSHAPADSRFNRVCLPPIGIDIIATNNNVQPGLAPGNRGRHVDLGALEDGAGRTRGQRRLVDRRRCRGGLRWATSSWPYPLAKRAASPPPVL